MCTVHSLRITVGFDISTIYSNNGTINPPLERWHLKCMWLENSQCEWPAQGRSMCISFREEGLGESPQQLRSPMSIWRISWKSEYGALRSSKEQFNPPIFYLFIAMSKLKIFPKGDFHTFHLFHCEWFERKKKTQKNNSKMERQWKDLYNYSFKQNQCSTKVS